MSLKFNLNQLEMFNKQSMNMKLPENIGYGEISQLNIEDGLIFHKFDITPKEDLVIENKFENQPLLSCNAFLKGEIIYHNKQFKFDKKFKENHLTISAINADDGLSYYKKNIHIKTFNLILTSKFIENNILKHTKEDKLYEIMDKLHKKPIFDILKENCFNYNTLLNLNNIDKTPFNGGLEKFYIQSKVYELLYNCLNILEEDTQYLSKEDIYYLEKVKKYIIINFNKNLNLLDLAKIGKTNKNKLQKNFKNYYKKTIFDFIIDCKMHKARDLLKNSDYNINEISNIVGYKYQGNFSLAFVKKFGIRPKDMLKSRSYHLM